MLALITAIYGDYDDLKDPAPQNGDVQCICFTDNPLLRSDVWDVRFWPKPHMIPFHAAKSFKYLPMNYVDATASVWVDGSVHVLNPNFTLEATEAARDGFALWPHPWNPSLEAEVDESLQQGRYQHQRLRDQLARYREEGFPPEFGPLHTAVVARAHNELTKAVGDIWEDELHWSIQDQVAFVYALWKAECPAISLPLGQAFLWGFRTPDRPDRWLSHHGHKR